MAYHIIFRDNGEEIERKTASTLDDAVAKTRRLIQPAEIDARFKAALRRMEQVEIGDCETVEIVRA